MPGAWVFALPIVVRVWTSALRACATWRLLCPRLQPPPPRSLCRAAQPGETVAAAAPETPEITVAPKAQPREGATGTNRDLSARRPGHPSLRPCTRPPSPPFAPGARSAAAAAAAAGPSSCDPTLVSSFLLSSRVPIE